MSKVDAQRAMREARYARNSASGPTAVRPPPVGEHRSAPAARTPTTKPAEPTQPHRADAAAAAEGELCGHKSMHGRACTRHAGHAEKNHRYG